MSIRSYRAALDRLLTPHGFIRDGDKWVRTRGEMWEAVDLQSSSIAGSTINLLKKDLETEKIILSIPCKQKMFMFARSQRIGHLIDGHDQWWHVERNGVNELSEAVRIHGLPYFDRVHSLEEQAAQWYGRNHPGKWHGPSKIQLAITLYRMGEVEEARATLQAPVPKTAIAPWVERVECVRRWLDHQSRAA